MRIQSSASRRGLDEIVLFRFDDHAFPSQRGVELQLNSHCATCGRTCIVLPTGPEGAPDSEHVTYYGTVIRIGDELWMWYLGQGRDETAGAGDQQIISAPIDLEGKVARLYLNIDRLNEYSCVSVEILDERLKPLPGYTHADCNPPTESGLKQAVTWGDKDTLSSSTGKIRPRVDFTGVRPEDVRLYVVYLNEVK